MFTRAIKEVHTTHTVPKAILCVTQGGGGGLDVRTLSELAQYQTYQLYVQMGRAWVCQRRRAECPITYISLRPFVLEGRSVRGASAGRSGLRRISAYVQAHGTEDDECEYEGVRVRVVLRLGLGWQG